MTQRREGEFIAAIWVAIEPGSGTFIITETSPRRLRNQLTFFGVSALRRGRTSH